MKEKLTTRARRIISGSVHSIIDSIENAAPESVLCESIREVESAIDEIQIELGQTAAKKHLAVSKLAEENKKHEDLNEKIKTAIYEKRDDLAEVAIARQLDIEAQIPVLESAVNDFKNREKDLEGYAKALKAKKREMKEELDLFAKNVSKTPGDPDSISFANKSDDLERRVRTAQSTFERVFEKNAGIPGNRLTSEMKFSAQLAELEEITRKNRVQERLSAIKGEIK
ncbi:Phage shock protein A (PspA) family protein [Candidatus Desulfarcum epimagneticum]|uniref:Phage shock protein A (PspA) family protein n=1 Tax=uncultured Desulfobacteraceae bacterium TaxID=218296 RepID=A0A484HGM9_9BACT|nr:Phage shock protein A (PspA) family protein [uncultured Desulfobacteraceae bacterium]